MIHDNAVVGTPLTLYKDTKANIEALSLTEGDKFWATDLDIEGYYDGSNIIWRPDDAGWVYTAFAWTYASTTTFTVSGDQTAIFAKGTKIKLTQTTVKYFYVTASSYSSPNTTVTITGGSDYTLANAAITNPAYSYASPPDFPSSFSWTPVVTFAGGTTDPTSFTVTNASFWMVRGVIYVSIAATITRGSGDRPYQIITLPVGYTAFFGGGMTTTYSGLQVSPFYQSGTNKVTIYTNTMTSDGYLWGQFFYL